MSKLNRREFIGTAIAAAPEDCFRFQIESGAVDAFVVGVEKVEHVDRLITGTQLALKELGYRTVTTAQQALSRNARQDV